MGGDPLQLGPVNRQALLNDPPVFWCRIFRDSFKSQYGSTVFLSGSHRQSSTGWFVECLERIRLGQVTDSDLIVLNATSDGVSEEDWDKRTQLRALNKDVNAYNKSKLACLPGPVIKYSCRDELNPNITHPRRIEFAISKLTTLAPQSVALKPGASVLLTREVCQVPSGTQGRVQECFTTHARCVFDGKIVDVRVVSFDVVDNCNVRLATRHALPGVGDDDPQGSRCHP